MSTQNNGKGLFAQQLTLLCLLSEIPLRLKDVAGLPKAAFDSTKRHLMLPKAGGDGACAVSVSEALAATLQQIPYDSADTFLFPSLRRAAC